MSENLLLIIDMQNDFVSEDGCLYVGGAMQDVDNLVKFVDTEPIKIDSVLISLDTHYYHQMFFPGFWEDGDGNSPEPFTSITVHDYYNPWRPVIDNPTAKLYLESLDKQNHKSLMIWPYHCVIGTSGFAMPDNLTQSLRKKYVLEKSIPISYLQKGMFTEQYSILEPEDSDGKDNVNVNWDVVNLLETYDNIYVSGEAKSHCVLSTLQSIERYSPETLRNITLLEDTMYSIPGHELNTENEIARLSGRWGMQCSSVAELCDVSS